MRDIMRITFFLFFCAFVLQNHVAEGVQLMIEGNSNSASKAVPGEMLISAKQESKASSNKMSSFFCHPVVLGVLVGLVMIGPDHLGTIMALSTLRSGWDSFKVGFCWGFGHSLGMILICPIFYLVKEVGSKSFNISLPQWEYFGDYFIGVSMVLVGVYFVIYESAYLERQEDGSYKANGCSCHGSLAIAESTDVPLRKDARKFCKAYGASDKHLKKTTQQVVGDNSTSDMQEDTPLYQRTLLSSLTPHDMKSAALGVFQGLCCPMGLAGVVFLGNMSINTSATKLMAFTIMLVLSSALGSGGIAVCWGALTTRGTSCLSARTLYRGSCFATLLFGVCWILANAGGVLDIINFAEHMTSKIAPAQTDSVRGL